MAPRREFICYSTLVDATMIDKEHKGKEIMFELSMGKTCVLCQVWGHVCKVRIPGVHSH